MKIAIISDSHGSIDRLQVVFQEIQRANIYNVLHAGDFLVDGVEDIFARFPNLNFFIAIGNNDVNQDRLNQLKRLKNVKIDEVVLVEFLKYKIAVSHYNGVAEKKFREISQKIDIFIHGHTHRPQLVRRGSAIMLNPGALCEDGKYLVLDLKTLKGERVFFNQKIS